MDYIHILQQLGRMRRRLSREEGLGSPPLIPYKLELFLTYRCNSRCRTCGIWRMEHTGREMTPAEIAAAVSSCGRQLFWVSFTGGEVFLRDDLSAVIKATAGAGESLQLLNLSTNGLLPERVHRVMSESMPALEEAGIDCTVTVSLDGLGRDHDRIRGVPGAFSRCMETAAVLARLTHDFPGLSYTFESTLSRYNLHDAGRLLVFGLANSAGFTPVFTICSDSALVARDRQVADHHQLRDEYLAALMSLARCFPLIRPADLVTRSYLRLAVEYLHQGQAPIPCVAGRATLTVEPDGSVRRCDYLPDRFGTLRDYGFNVVRFLREQRPQDRMPPCRRCFHPCQAYPSIMDLFLARPLQAIKLLF